MADKTPECPPCPPFPPLRWEWYSWDCEITLPSWAGYGWRGADGKARLSVSAVDHERHSPPTPEQVAAFRYLLENEAAIAAAAAEEVVRYCPGEAYEGDEYDEVETADDLRPHIGLRVVHVLSEFRGGVAYLGFELDCAWDEEHGCGVLTHRGRVVAVGQADCSFDGRIAKDDKGDPKSGQR